ncbi:TetR/AcrR family transcriptional regulator [Ruicaihuangia caeni]|uniref:TetR/AcrR family transcriptional regulator n=1 Tax=Ruicaihuangia caeni TaxID=3042517 RepID=UPI00338FF049
MTTLSNRTRALEAAVQVLGSQGVRALTHARVDEAAGLPKGSTSNSFRTRASLLAGVVEWLDAADRSGLDDHGERMPQTPEQFVDALTSFALVATGPERARTTARFALFVEAAHNDTLRETLARGRAHVLAGAEATLRALGAQDPVTSARTIGAVSDGVMLHRLTVDPGLDPRPHLQAAVDAALH